tara:strand:+ start:1149 stop:2267 length:1119 start_codon:yes stop_codon:yes gene_type:complete
MSVNYSSVIPENNKSSYGEYDTIDFVMTFENQSLRLGSIRLEGDLEVLYDGAPLNTPGNETRDIRYDHMVGVHGCVESVQTEMLGETIENLTEYPRMVKQYAVGRNNAGDMFNSSRVCELRAPLEVLTTEILRGEEPRTQVTSAIRNNPDFSCKLDTVLNSSTEMLPYSRTGAIRLSLNLARVNSFLYGLGVDNKVTYSLKDLRLVYRTMDGMDNKEPITLRRRINIKQSIQSSLANIQVKVPSTQVEAFSSSFQIQSQENTPRYNNLTLEKIPELQQLTFLFNDQSNANITYLLKSNMEVLDKFIEALGDTGRNSLAVPDQDNKTGYGVGLRMSGGTIDLTNQKFSVQIDSAISNNVPLVYYMYFHCLVSV